MPRNLARCFSLLCLLALTTGAQAQNFFGLLDAGPQDFAVLNLGGNFQFNSDSTSQYITITGTVGSVGLESGSSTSISGAPKTTATGTLYLGPGLSNPGGAVFAGGTVTGDARLGTSGSAVTHAKNASTTLFALSPDQTFGTTPTTITATHSGQNVIKLSGDITGDITLDPSTYSNVSFVVNVFGKIQLSGGTGLLTTNGLADLSVLYNVAGTVATSGGGTELASHGIILAPQSSIAWDAVPLDGELIGQSVAVVSGGRVNNPFTVVTGTPEPDRLTVFACLAVAGIMFTRKRRIAV